MSAINSDTQQAWQRMADHASLQRPTHQRRVVVTGGRKYKGVHGTVSRHAQDKYDDALRYGSAASQHLTVMMGRSGFAVLIQPDDGGQRFWVKAKYVCCLDDDGRPCLTDTERALFAGVCEHPGEHPDEPELPDLRLATSVLIELGLAERRSGHLFPTSMGTVLHEQQRTPSDA